ncbi:MAG: ATP12 family protein [Pseudomonadota bacterium]
MRDILTDMEKALADGQADPMGSAQRSMRPKLAKRFYEDVTISEAENGYVVHLDGRTVKTPGKVVVAFTTEDAAKLVADEFSAQIEVLDPMLMPCYRLANTALDGVALDMQAVIEDVLRFCGSDLLCYRADSPDDLVNRQRAAWDGPLDWIEGLLGAQFRLAEGVMHVAQPRETISAYGAEIKSIENPMVMAAFHSMMTLTGSAILALAVFKEHLSAADAWNAAHVDEDHVIEHWGEDQEAKERRAYRWAEMDAADRMLKALL